MTTSRTAFRSERFGGSLPTSCAVRRPAPTGTLAPPQDAVGQGDLELPPPRSRKSGARTEGHARPDTREHQTGLLPAVDEPDRYPGGRFEQGIELVAVRSLTQRARPDGYETVDTGALGDVAEPKDGLGRACGELTGHPPGPSAIPRLSTTRSRITGDSEPSSSASATRSWNVVPPRSRTASRMDAIPGRSSPSRSRRSERSPRRLGLSRRRGSSGDMGLAPWKHGNGNAPFAVQTFGAGSPPAAPPSSQRGGRVKG